MSKHSTSDNFNAICDLFCHLANALEKEGYQDISEDIDHLMTIWISRAFIK